MSGDSRIDISQARAEMSIIKTSSAPTTLTPQQQELANDLMNRHGNVRVANEVHGLHYYIACPDCLQEEGEDELWKMHLAINVEKYHRGKSNAASCMKTGKTYMVDELAFWPVPLEKRGYPTGPPKIINNLLISSELHEQDAKGRWVPKGPGETVPLNRLPLNHPAMQYVHSRGFAAVDLERQFHAEFCVKERTDIKYRKLLGGFKASPQGRIIFYIYQNGIRMGWQARILEFETEDEHFYWQPYREVWIPVESRQHPSLPWEPYEGWEDWDPAKYVMAHGARRNSCIMGYDAAKAWNIGNHRKIKFCFLFEGPTDAARMKPPAVATCGKVCSQEQANILEATFDMTIVVPDNDAAGSKLVEYVSKFFKNPSRFSTVKLPARFKDMGLMSDQDAKMFRIGAMKYAGLL